MKAEPKDPRSTGRRRAQRVLERLGTPKFCGSRPNNAPPADYGCGRTTEQYPRLMLDVNHINKNILDVDPVNLEYLCRSCHKDADKVTAKGVSVKGDEFGYGY